MRCTLTDEELRTGELAMLAGYVGDIAEELLDLRAQVANRGVQPSYNQIRKLVAETFLAEVRESDLVEPSLLSGAAGCVADRVAFRMERMLTRPAAREHSPECLYVPMLRPCSCNPSTKETP